jgi:hypothetical protein
MHAYEAEDGVPEYATVPRIRIDQQLCWGGDGMLDASISISDSSLSFLQHKIEALLSNL